MQNNIQTDYRQELMQEIAVLPDNVLPQLLELVHLFAEKSGLRSPKSDERSYPENRGISATLGRNRTKQVSQIAQQAFLLAEERKHWSRERHLNRLIEVAEELRLEAIAKGVAIQDEREAAVDS